MNTRPYYHLDLWALRPEDTTNVEHLSLAMTMLRGRRGVCPHIPGDEALLFRRIYKRGFQREKHVSYEKREQIKNGDKNL